MWLRRSDTQLANATAAFGEQQNQSRLVRSINTFSCQLLLLV
jgi:hypothetical protein